MLKSDISYLVLSDVHLGHQKTKTSEIINNLNIFFDNFRSVSKLKDLDLVFIAGDLFDRLLDFNSQEIHDATIWLYKLMSFCKRWSIKLRILEGTPSHDWRQSKIIETLNTMEFEGLDVRYIDTLYIEKIEDLDMTILYVPDEWTSKTDTTWLQVQDLLKDNDLNEVDIAIMHGCFRYQVGTLADRIDTHKESNYLNIVKYYINIGHFHTFSTYERIIAQGSFDRLAHGEEEDKGATIVHIGDEPRFYFIANKGAKRYVTLTIRYKDVDKALRSLDNKIKGLVDGSYVRLKLPKDSPLYVALDDIKLKYPQYIFTKLAEETLEEKAVIETMMSEYTAISITPNNIIELLLDGLVDKYDLGDDDKASITKTLEKIHHEL